ncbi:MAG: fibronectin type III domain-containing protein [Clostridia bacterium]|nr:fibronectin type III domain-containing protein [Clostridia bacterium]
MKRIRNTVLCCALALCMTLNAGAAGVLAANESTQPSTAAQSTESHRHSFGIWNVERAATNKKNGLLVRVCSGCGLKQTKVIARISSAKVQQVDKTYTGKAIKNKIVVKNKDGRVLRENRDYTVAYRHNKNVGVADMIITGIGKYDCTFKRSFRILPQGTEFTKVLPSSKLCQLAWTAVRQQTTGYVLQYSTDKRFQDKAGTYTQKLANPATAALTVKDLKPKTTYYVRIRTYTETGGRTFQSPWCKAQKFTTLSLTPWRIEGQLPKTARVDASYFDDVVFVGDSISTGLSYYEAANNVLGQAQFLTSVSLSATNALWPISDRSVHPRYNGQKMKVEDAIPLTGCKKVYIMLGMNDIVSLGVDRSVANFTTLCNKILANAPDVQLYVESVTPRTNQGAKSDNGVLNNKNINLYNRKLAALCQQRGWYFVNVAEVMYDSTGYLNRSYCSDPNGMGMHFANAGCKVWVEYLYTHTA